MDTNNDTKLRPTLLFPGQYLIEGSVGPLHVNYDLNDPCQQMAEVVITRGIYIARHFTPDELEAIAKVLGWLAGAMREPSPPF